MAEITENNNIPVTNVDGKMNVTHDVNIGGKATVAEGCLVKGDLEVRGRLICENLSGGNGSSGGSGLTLGETSETAYPGDKGKANATAISALRQEVSTAKGLANSNQALLNSHTSEIKSIDTLANNNNNTLVTLEQRVSDNESDISEIQGSVGASGGIAPLNYSGKVALQYLPTEVSGLLTFGGIVEDEVTVQLNSYLPQDGDYSFVVYDSIGKKLVLYVPNVKPMYPGVGTLTDSSGVYYANWDGSTVYGTVGLNGVTPFTNRVYVNLVNLHNYLWTGGELKDRGTGELTLGETSETAYPGDKGKANAEGITGLAEALGDLAGTMAIGEMDMTFDARKKFLTQNKGAAYYKVTRNGVPVGLLMMFGDSGYHGITQVLVTNEVLQSDGKFNGSHSDYDTYVYERKIGTASQPAATSATAAWGTWRNTTPLPAANVTQEMGDSETLVMSQKAVTEIAGAASNAAQVASAKAAESSAKINLFVEDIQQRIDNIETINGDVTNNPDEEDLTEVDNALKLADRAYNPLLFSGKGFKILRKNVSANKNILTQEMMSAANTVYEIRYDYDLDGATITIPEGCTLKFEGGSLSNGSIVGKNTKVVDNSCGNIFNDCAITGFNVDVYDIRWFGAIPDLHKNEDETFSGTDCSGSLKRAILAANSKEGAVVRIVGAYYACQPIELDEGSIFIEGLYKSNFITTAKESYQSCVYVDNCTLINVVKGESIYNRTVYIKNLRFIGSGASSGARILDYSVTGGPTRVGLISDCVVSGFSEAFLFRTDGSSTWGTVYGNMTIERVYAYSNAKFLVASGNQSDTGYAPSLCNLIVRDCNIEWSTVNAFDLSHLFGATIITNNILEGQRDAIKIDKLIGGSIEISNNYFEKNKGDYIVYVKGLNPFRCFAKIENNYGITLSEPYTGEVQLRNVTVNGCLGNSPEITFYSSEIFAGEEMLPKLNSNNTSGLNTIVGKAIADKSYYDKTEVNFGNQYLREGVVGLMFSASDGKHKVGQFKKNLSPGKIYVMCFYMEGSQFNISITNNNNVIYAERPIYSTAGMCFIKFSVSSSTTASVSSIFANSIGETRLGNGYLYEIDDDEGSYLSYGKIGVQSTFVSKFNNDFTGGAVKGTIGVAEGQNVLMYSDGEVLRNSSGQPADNEKIITRFVDWGGTFTSQDTNYVICGTLDLNGREVVVPSGCTIDLTRGKITNGIITLTGTMLYPLGLNVGTRITARLFGSYAEGQIRYNGTSKCLELWNGTAWVNLDGSALE